MKHVITLTVFFGLIGFFPVNVAADAVEDTIKSRQGFYRVVVHNAGQLFAMAKGEMEYDAARATTAANNLVALSTLDNGTLWVADSSKENYPGKTRALQKIWDTYPAVLERMETWKQAVAAVAGVAGGGVEALRTKISDLGGSCKGCHDNFRAKEF